MFAYDLQLLALLQTPPASVADVLNTMQSIDQLAADGDGLKWFNWLYWHVTQAVERRIEAGGFTDAVFLASLDVEFAKLYFNALKASLAGTELTGCWQTLFSRRGDARLARIQCALAGINAHINHDLPFALVNTCALAGSTPQAGPQHNTSRYNDYTSLNATLDSLIDEAKQTLNVRLLGSVMPPVNMLEDTIAAWSVCAAREAAWNNAELLWHLRGEAPLAGGFDRTLDGLATVVSKSLLVAVP
jgi:hypothetical protein